MLDEKIPQDIVHTHQQLMAALAFSIAKFCAVQPAAVDADVLTAIQALAQTYKTLSSGIIYEKPPDSPLPRELYAALITFIAEVKKQQAEHADAAALKDLDLFFLWVFLYRMGLLRTNGRPRSRRFIEFLRGQLDFLECGTSLPLFLRLPPPVHNVTIDSTSLRTSPYF